MKTDSAEKLTRKISMHTLGPGKKYAGYYNILKASKDFNSYF
jgi:hypothetical protein